MNDYHFLISSLPELFFDKKSKSPEFDFYINELKIYLHPDDYKKIQHLLIETDNINLLNHLSENNKPFINGGNYSQEELIQEIKSSDTLPQYLQSFISYFNSHGAKISYSEYEKRLLNGYYEYVTNLDHPFLKTWFIFERNLKNIITANLAEQHDHKAKDEMIGDQSVIDEILFYKGKNFDLSHRLPNYNRLIQILNQKDILEREREIDHFKWNYLNEITLFNYFSIEVILSYTLKLKILKRWEAIDEEAGVSKLNNIINELQNTQRI